MSLLVHMRLVPHPFRTPRVGIDRRLELKHWHVAKLNEKIISALCDALYLQQLKMKKPRMRSGLFIA